MSNSFMDMQYSKVYSLQLLAHCSILGISSIYTSTGILYHFIISLPKLHSQLDVHVVDTTGHIGLKVISHTVTSMLEELLLSRL